MVGLSEPFCSSSGNYSLFDGLFSEDDDGKPKPPHIPEYADSCCDVKDE